MPRCYGNDTFMNSRLIFFVFFVLITGVSSVFAYQKNEVTVNRKKNIESFRNILKNKLKKPKTNKIEDSNKIEIPEMDNVEAFGSYASFKKKN